MGLSVVEEIALLESSDPQRFTVPGWSKDESATLLAKLKKRFPKEKIVFFTGTDKCINIGETAWIVVQKYFCDTNGGQLFQLNGSDNFYRWLTYQPKKVQRYRGRPYERYQLIVDSKAINVSFSNARDLGIGIALALALADD